jgi:hypothetical protein
MKHLDKTAGGKFPPRPGEMELARGKSDKAQKYFERALAIARQQQAKSWELRASMSLARLWRDQGKPQQARETLAPVYGWFAEGFDTRDLKEAKARLDRLHARQPISNISQPQRVGGVGGHDGKERAEIPQRAECALLIASPSNPRRVRCRRPRRGASE